MCPENPPSDNHKSADPPDDQGLSPILPGRPGRRSFSLEALRERIEAQFIEETQGRADILAELDTPDAQRALIQDVADYVLAMENLFVPPRDKAALIERLRQSLFGLGPLEAFLEDDRITEIVLEGPHVVHVRVGMEALTRTQAAFDDTRQLVGVLSRLLAPAGIDLSLQPPTVETGLVLAGRYARLSLIGPPISPQYTVNLRLHPRQSWSLDTLAQRDVLPAGVLPLLRAILQRKHGLLIVGEPGIGKTTLLSALLQELPDSAKIEIVARTAEFAIPSRASLSLPDPADDDLSPLITAALDRRPTWLLLDEWRGSESSGLRDALSRPDTPAYLWTMRGSNTPERLLNALALALHRADPALEQAAVHRALAEHLPFVLTLRRVDTGPQVDTLAEWVLENEGEALAFTPLYTADDGLTGYRSRHDLTAP